ncbi:MAG: DUF3971 domain-containing protein [Alphaproteobacteria bacterium]|nr:DUF3971 domain-containing protein [Alphaproteobacteria bacterium]
MLRFLRYIVEAIAAFVGVTIVLGLLLAWRLYSAPVSSDYLTPYIAAGIETVLPGSAVHLGSTLVTWDMADRVLSVHAENIKVDDASGFEIASIPSFDAKISVLGLVFGHFLPRDLSIDHPQIKLDHAKDGSFVFGGVAMNGTGRAASSETIGTALRKLSGHLSHTALLRKLAVTRAIFDVHDEETQTDWSVSVPEISISRMGLGALVHAREYGALDGHMTIEITQKDAVASLDAHYAYDPAARTHSLSAVFTDVTPAFIAGGHPETLGLPLAAIVDLPLTGKIKLTFDKSLSVIDVAAQIHGDQGQLVYPTFWDKPCPIQSFDMSADYDQPAHRLTVSDTRVDLGGPTLGLKIEGGASAQAGKDMDFTAEVKVDHLPMNRYEDFWPKPVLPDPRYWLTTNLRDGTFDHAEATLKGALAWNDLANLFVTEGNGKVVATNGRVTYVDGMPPVENVDATATFDLKKMAVQITSGGIGSVRLSPFTLRITGLADPDQNIEIPLRVSGPVPDILRLLDHKPLGYAKALGLSPDDISGKIEGTVKFRFPLLKTLAMKDVSIEATANASGIASTKLIPGVPIDRGNLELTLDTSGLNLKGRVDLGKAPFQVVWQENFERKAGQPLRHVTASGAVAGDQWNNLGVTALGGTKGPINVALDMTKPDKNKMLVSGTLDMTPAALTVDMLDWKKQANMPAILNFSAVAVEGKPVVVSSLTLRGDQITAKGDATLSADMSQLLSLNLSPLVLGRTDASLSFTQSFGPQGALRFDAKGASLDVGGLRGGNDPDKTDPRPKDYHVQVGKLYTSDIGEIDQAQGSASRDQDGWLEINLHGLADGSAPLDIELTPQPDGHRTFKIACDNFGKAMKGLGFTDTIRGGKLSVVGQSAIETPRVIIGKAKISDFTVVKLPVLALLLNAASPFGFTGILTDSADFSRFEGDYRWQGDAITLTRAHAAGSAVGINIDGKVDMNSGDANLQGTVVPFSVVNNLLNYIPVIGGLITGGKDQGVLAVSYQITGKLSSPEISVNPVSLLTPGFIRNLFFRDDAGNEEK